MSKPKIVDYEDCGTANEQLYVKVKIGKEYWQGWLEKSEIEE